jgi:hypothetical protein
MDQSEIAQKSPYVLELAPGTYWWFAAASPNIDPFCDGTHITTCFSPVKFEIGHPQTVALSGCKRKTTPPICNGTVRQL